MTRHPEGAWIWRLSKLRPDYLDKLQDVGCKRVYLKVFDGKSEPMFWGEQCTKELVAAFHVKGIEVYGWGYHYGSADVDEQVESVRQALNCRLDGYVLDVEAEVKDKQTHNDVKQLLQALRPYIKEGTLGYTSFGHPGFHPTVPWQLLDELCDFAMPQMYFEKWTFGEKNDKERIDEAFAAHKALALNKLILPIWGSESDTVNPASSATLQQYLQEYPGASIWRLPYEGEAGEAWNLSYDGESLTATEPVLEQKQAAAKAIFKMALKFSSGLLHGHFTLYDASNQQIFTCVVTTGRPGYQSAGHMWQRATGPIPDLEGLSIGTEDAIIESNEILGWSFPIYPTTFDSPDSGASRGGFRLYSDAGLPGTAGGIGVLNAESFQKLRALLITVNQAGAEQIPLEIQYTKSRESVVASAIFELRRAHSRKLLIGNLSLLDDNEETIFSADATSGAPGYQSADFHWKRAAGALPSEEMISNGPIFIDSHGYYSSKPGIAGNFYPIGPLYFKRRQDGYTRSEFGVHLDANAANAPGSAGCIVFPKRQDFDMFKVLMAQAKTANRRRIPLAVLY